MNKNPLWAIPDKPPEFARDMDFQPTETRCIVWSQSGPSIKKIDDVQWPTRIASDGWLPASHCLIGGQYPQHTPDTGDEIRLVDTSGNDPGVIEVGAGMLLFVAGVVCWDYVDDEKRRTIYEDTS